MYEITENKELDNVKSKLSKCLNLSRDVICVINESGKFIIINEAASYIWGYPPESLKGESYLKFVYEEDIELTKGILVNVMNGSYYGNFENRYIHKDGTLISMIWSAQWGDDEKEIYCTAREATPISQAGSLSVPEEFTINEIKLRTAVAIARLGYWQINLDGTNRYWSDEVYSIWGVTRETFSIEPDALLSTIHIEDREIFETKQSASFAGIKEIDLEYRILCPDGAIKWIHELGKLVSDEKGNSSLIQGTVQDITGQKSMALLLEESDLRYKYLTQATTDGTWEWDIVKNKLYRGNGYKDITGKLIHTSDFDIDSWRKTLHPQDIGRIKNSLYKVFDSLESNWNEEYRILKTDGSYAFVVDRAFVIRDKNGKAIRMIGAMQDISVRKKAEAELKVFADDLYKRNKELHQFGYVVSHNLRAPVANIMGLTMLLETEIDDADTVEKCVKDLKTSISSLDKVILDLSEILAITDGSANLKLEKLNLIEILDNVRMDLREAINQHGIKIISPLGPCEIYSHKAYLYSVFHNLISNAIKYKAEQKPFIKIRIKSNIKYLIINISDNGVGIDINKHKEDLFKPYKRFNSIIEGKGLGLFLVKSHVEALNGKISINSKLGKGTTFLITLPINTSG
ncbi:MAG: PAS domain-containing sensor histidine kinase [Bacteroidota bacterium]|nr:PAS domain-containing sensor histidine kinase [Bacteroidota bacterium]